MERTKFNKLGFGTALGLVGFSTLAYGAAHQAVLAAVYVIIAVLVLFWALDCRTAKSLRFSTSLLPLPLLAAAIYGFIQVIPFGTRAVEAGVSEIPNTISVDPFSTLTSTAHFLALAAFLAVVLTFLDSADRMRKLAVFLMVFGFAFAFFAVLQAVLSPDKIYGIYGRPGASVFGSFVNRNHFAAWMEMAIALPLGLLFGGVVPKEKRLLYVTAVSLMGVSLVASGSRAGLVVLVTEVLVLLLFTRASGRGHTLRRIALVAALFVSLTAGAAFVGRETSLTRIADATANPTAATAQDRSNIWSVGVQIVKHSMPFGVGLGAFGTAYTGFDKSGGMERAEQAHNDFLQVLTDAGVPGLLIGLAFLALVVRLGKKVIAIENEHRKAVGVAALTGIIGVLVHSFFDFVLHTTAVALLFLLLLSLLDTSARSLPDDTLSTEPRRKRRHRSRPDQPEFLSS